MVRYRHALDPPKEAMATLENKLGGLAVLDRMPGALLVEGTLEEVSAKVVELGADWVANRQQQAISRPPGRKLKGPSRLGSIR